MLAVSFLLKLSSKTHLNAPKIQSTALYVTLVYVQGKHVKKQSVL